MQHGAPNPYPPPGTVIDNKYRIERMLGEGGMGAVAEATHLLFHNSVALKFMNPQFVMFPGAVERFLNEGKASATIQSEHVVKVTDGGKLTTGAPYLVMEFMDGQDLSDLLSREGKPGLPPERAVHFLVQVLRGLQVAHATGIIHRDMKPSNCFVVRHEGEDDFVKILDFGISKVAQPGGGSLTQTNSALGTPLYMSPEQAKSPRDVDARSDLYSSGVILYELLTGSTPYTSSTGELMEILYQLFTVEVPPIRSRKPELSDELAVAVHKALARDPNDRYASAQEMAEALAPFGTDRTRALVARMAGFVPTRRSQRPAGPASMVAFSALTAQGSRMPTPPPPEPSLPHAAQTGPTSRHAPAANVATGALNVAGPDAPAATAHTQMARDSLHPEPAAPVPVRAMETSGSHPHAAYASTPPPAVRDNPGARPSVAPPAPPRGLVVGLVIVGVLGFFAVVGAGVTFVARSVGGSSPSASGVAVTQPVVTGAGAAPSDSATPLPPPVASLSAATVSVTASVTAPSASTSPSASASLVVPQKRPPQPQHPAPYDPTGMGLHK